MLKKNKLIFIIFLVLIIILFMIAILVNFSVSRESTQDTIEVYAKEIELEKLRENIIVNDSSNIINNENKNDNIVNKIFEEKVLVNESKKRNISIEEEQKENLKKISFNNPISEENQQKIRDMNLTEEEFRNNLYEKLINMQLRVKLKEQLLEEIFNNDIKVDNNEFKVQVKSFNDDKNSNNYSAEELFTKTEELLDKYISILKSNYSKLEK